MVSVTVCHSRVVALTSTYFPYCTSTKARLARKMFWINATCRAVRPRMASARAIVRTFRAMMAVRVLEDIFSGALAGVVGGAMVDEPVAQIPTARGKAAEISQWRGSSRRRSNVPSKRVAYAQQLRSLYLYPRRRNMAGLHANHRWEDSGQ